MPASSSMQLAALALHLGLLDSAQFRELDEALQAGLDPSVFITERGWLDGDDLAHLSHVLERCLKTAPDWLSLFVESSAADSTWNATPPLPAGDAKQTAPQTGTLASSYRRFRVQQLHATGGIGRVWIAHDDALGRQVALKDLRPELSEPGHQVRFVEEAKITARLEHPGIVPVYELARGDDGQPFYVMRFVKGKTLSEAITRFHEARQANKAKPVDFLHLIEAFRAICQTVAYAHAQGVLHRDLKPANILLGGFGEVLVLDWGLAKSGGPGGDAKRTPESMSDSFDPGGSATQTGQILGTPAYMSPEQASGHPDTIDTRSDVWGLGAMLYEILTGRPPFCAGSIETLLRMINEDPPTLPRALNPDASPALEAVCLKALAKRPLDRYASAALLADEIQRFLADEPVEARREPLTQRIARWMRHHRALVTGASALLVTAVIALAVSTVLVGRQYARAEVNLKKALDTADELTASNTRVRQENARAEANLLKALDAVETFYVRVSEDRLLDEHGMQPLRARLLGDAVRYGEEFAAENQHDPRRHVDRARFRLLLGNALAQTEKPARALEKLDEARTLYAALRAQSPQSAEYLHGEAFAELNIGNICLKTDPERARQSLEMAHAKFQQLVQEDPQRLLDREKMTLTLNSLGTYYERKKQFDQALEQFRLALASSEVLIDKARDNRSYQHDHAGILANIGRVFVKQGRLADARTFLERSVDIRQKLARQKTKDLWLEEQLAGSQNMLGNLCWTEEKHAEAEKHHREALRLREILAIRNPNVAKYRELIAWDHYNISRALERQMSKSAAAFAEIATAIAQQKKLQAEAPQEVEYTLGLGQMYFLKSEFHRRRSDAKAMIDTMTQAIYWIHEARKLDAVVGRHDLMNAYWYRAQAHGELAQFRDAVLDYDRALEFTDAANRKALESERSEAVKKRDSKQ